MNAHKIGTYPLKKIIGVSMMAVSIVGFVVLLLPLWFLLIYPTITLLFAALALLRLCIHSPSPRIPRAMELLARIFLGAATLTAVFVVCMSMSDFAPGTITHRVSDWLCFGSLLIPQLLWLPRFRSRPLAALLIAIASLVPTVQYWVDLQSS
jgi:hypothetical protein